MSGQVENWIDDMVVKCIFISFRAQFVQALVLSTIANLDSFRLAAEDDSEQMAISDSAIVTVDSGDGGVVLGNTAENEAVDQRRNPSSINNNNSTAPSSHPNMNAVNKKDELEEAEVAVVVGINHNNSSDSRPTGGPPPVKPKPPTATKPVPHNLPNYTSERGAGRGGPSAGGHGTGGGGIGKGRSQRAEQQQQQQPQPQSNQGASSGQGAAGGTEAR